MSDQILGFGGKSVTRWLLSGMMAVLPVSLMGELEWKDRRSYEQTLGYTYVEAFTEKVTLATPLVDSAIGASARVSISPKDQIYFTGWLSYASGDDTVLGVDVEADVYVGTVGVGFYQPMSDDFHLTLEIGGIFGELDAGAPSLTGIEDVTESFAGAYIMPGARLAVGERFELHGNLLLNTSDYGGNVILRGQAYFELFNGVDVSAGGTFGDDVEWLSFGGRVRW